MRLNNNLISSLPQSFLKNSASSAASGPLALLGSGGGGLLESNPVSLSNMGQLLGSRQKSLTKRAIGVLDAANLVQTAHEGLKKAKGLLSSLKELLSQAQSADLSAGQKQELDLKIKTLVEDYSKLLADTVYDKQKVLTQDRNFFVATGTGNSETGLRLGLNNVSLEKLGVVAPDLNNDSSVRRVSDKVRQAISSVQKQVARAEAQYDRLGKAGDALAKVLQGLMKKNEMPNAGTAQSAAQKLIEGQMAHAQKVSPALSQYSLF